jgi:hypothetical protein
MINWGRIFYRVQASIGERATSPKRLWWRQDIDGPEQQVSDEDFEFFLERTYLPRMLAITGASRAWQLINVASDLQVGADAPARYLHVFEFDDYDASQIVQRLPIAPTWKGRELARVGTQFSTVLLELTAKS